MITEFFRRLYSGIDRFAHKPAALWLLLSVSIVEASLFPLSVDIPLIALGTFAPRKALSFGLVASAGSFLGGYLGYYIGFALFDLVGKPLLEFYGIDRKSVV